MRAANCQLNRFTWEYKHKATLFSYAVERVPKSSLKVALIGYGVAGKVFHAPVIRAVSGVELTHVVRRSGERIPELPDVRVIGDAGEVLREAEIDVVVIATPNPSHLPLGMAALEAGKHVVIDKPFTITSGDADALIGLAEKKQRVLSVYQNRRWDGDFQTLRALLASGALGDVVSYESNFDRFRLEAKPNAWREQRGAGNGVLWDLGPHLIDQALTLFGKPKAITADVRQERPHAQVDDSFDIHLHYAGLTVLLRATMVACAARPWFVVNGTAGSFVKHGIDPQEGQLKAGMSPADPEYGIEAEAYWGTLTRCSVAGKSEERIATRRGSYAGFYENLRDAVRGSAKLEVTANQARDVVRLIELAHESSASGTRLEFRD